MQSRFHSRHRPLLAAFVLAGFGLAMMGQVAAGENTATKPVPRDANWMKRHQGFVEIAKQGGVDVLFLGDSITDAWGGSGRGAGGGSKIFERVFAPLKTANFGISGDRTQHVLWRITNGELDGIEPKVAMLMIGTNNSNGADNTAEEIAEGIAAIVQTLRNRQPQMKILLLGIFPRAETRDEKTEKVASDGLRKKTQEVNQIIAKLDDGKFVRYLDIGPKFLDADGALSKSIMPDFLHLSEKGYQIWADAVAPAIQELLGK